MTEVNVVSTLAGIAEDHTAITTIDVLGFREELIDSIDTIESGAVVLDSSGASRGRVDLSIVDDGTHDLDDMTDPLAPNGNELRVRKGIVRRNSIDVVQLGIFGINRSAKNKDGTISISGIDRSWRYIDSPFEEPYEVPSGTQVNDALEEVLTLTWPDVQMNFMETDVQLPRIQAEEAEDKWAFILGLAMAIGGELYFDDFGVARLAPVPTPNGQPVAAFAEGEGGVLLNADREFDRDPVINKWTVTGESTTEDGAIPRAIAVDMNPQSPTFYEGNFGKKPDFYDNEFITTTDQASRVAASLLARSIGRPDNMSFDTLVDPSRRPGDLVRVTREQLGVDEDHLIDVITIPLTHEGTMTSETRVAQELLG